MVEGLAPKSITVIPRVYNFVMLIKLYLVFGCILSLQSASFAQSIMFTSLELSYLFFIVFYQTTTEALSSKAELVIRVLESITLSLFGVVCTLYSLRGELTDEIGKYISYPTFFIFVTTMIVEYCNLVITLVILIKKAIYPEKNKRSRSLLEAKNQEKIDPEPDTQQGFKKAMEDRDAPQIQSNTQADDIVKYWKNHPFIVLEEIDKNQRKINLRRSIKHLNRRNKNNSLRRRRKGKRRLSPQNRYRRVTGRLRAKHGSEDSGRRIS